MRVETGTTHTTAEPARFTFDGEALTGLAGESLAAALTALGRLALRHDGSGGMRGVFCGMGVCQECLVAVDGMPHRQACMTALHDGMTVESDDSLPPVRPVTESESSEAAPAYPLAPDVLVIGGGPAGLSAALAAREAGAEVALIDERPALGGQFFKQLSAGQAFAEGRPSDRQYRDGGRLIDAVVAAGVKVVSGAQVWGAFPGPEIALAGPDGAAVLRPRRLVLATGAYERGLPAPGWTLPGVMTTGAAQTLLRAYRVLPGCRILVAGNGPLNVQVAAEMVDAGAQVVAVAELARRPGPWALPHILAGLAASPGLMRDGARYLARLRRAGVPVLWGHVLAEAIGPENGVVSEAVVGPIDGEGGAGLRRYAVDAVCMGYGFLPQNELARALGCDHAPDPKSGALMVARAEDGRTSVPEVFVTGDAGGLGGAKAAQVQGRMAGLAAARDLGFSAAPTSRLSTDLRRHHRFQAALWRLFAADLPLPASPDVTVCRCENLSLADVEAALETGTRDPGALKRMTRLGMGRCQGRYCMPVLMTLLAARRGVPVAALDHPAPRAPAKPLRIADLAARPASGHVAITEESGTVGD